MIWITPKRNCCHRNCCNRALKKHGKNTSPSAPCMVYLPTWLGDVFGKCWCAYSSTIEHMGYNYHIPSGYLT
jgi:hypothetical protein